jgi:hypothetical protein
MRYKVKHLVSSIDKDVLFIYGYDSSGQIVFSVNCIDEIKHGNLRIIDKIFIMIGQYKVMSVYMTKFLNCTNKPMLEIIDTKNNTKPEQENN